MNGKLWKVRTGFYANESSKNQQGAQGLSSCCIEETLLTERTLKMFSTHFRTIENRKTDAFADANGLSLRGFDDWRLPNPLELRVLRNDETAAGDWLAQAFDNVQAANVYPCYWTSTSSVNDSANRAVCGFLFEGSFSQEMKTAWHYVWPVRDPLGLFSH